MKAEPSDIGRAKIPVSAAVFAALVIGAIAAHAESAIKKPVRRSQPASTTQSAPDTTGTLAKAVPAPPAQTSTEETIPSPFYLPDVPRTRMRACGETWRTKKMAGDVGDDAWRDFANKCLSAKDAPPAQ